MLQQNIFMIQIFSIIIYKIKISPDAIKSFFESKKRERSAQTKERFRNFVLRYAASSYLKELEAYIQELDKKQ